LAYVFAPLQQDEYFVLSHAMCMFVSGSWRSQVGLDTALTHRDIVMAQQKAVKQFSFYGLSLLEDGDAFFGLLVMIDMSLLHMQPKLIFVAFQAKNRWLRRRQCPPDY
jgi:hypothetical protein